MTREDAIDIIRRECYVFNPLNFETSIMINMALDMAVKALSAEPCEDAISRKWLKNAIHNFYKGLIHTPTEEDIQAYIDVAPSVTPQPKTGHWKRISIDKYSTHANYWYRCDRCGEDNLGDTAWCPSCGCRMVENEVEE